MKNTPGRGPARPSCNVLSIGPARPPCAVDRPRRRVVVAPGHGDWDLATILRLRTARPELHVDLAYVPTNAESIAAAFRSGADAYVLGAGDPDADRRFVQEHCVAPPFRAFD